MIFLFGINILLIFGTLTLMHTSKKNQIDQLRSNISTFNYILTNQILSNGIESYQNTANVSEKTGKINQVEHMATQVCGRILLVDAKYHVILDTYHQREGKYYVTPNMIDALSSGTDSSQKIGENQLEILTPVVDQESGQIYGAIVTTASLQDVNAQNEYLRVQNTVLIGIFFLISFSLSILILLMIRNPFVRMRKELSSMVAGHSDTQLSESKFIEFDKIASAINELSEKNQKLEDTRQEFVSNVSHELKTPITSMKILADSLVMQENVPLEIYQEFMEDIVHEVDRENQIISDLLELVKMDKKKADLNIESTNINELLEEIMRRVFPIAEKRSVQMHLETMRNVTAEVDRGKLSMALTNLIENAVKYNVDEGKVNVSLNADHKFFYVRVKDTGVGIPEEFQELIFDRFYRVDKARSRDTGGTGLGLAITRNIILLHKGSIKVHSTEGKGSTFIVRIPLNYV